MPSMNRRRLGATLLTFFASIAIRTDRREMIRDFDFTGFVTDRALAAAVGAAYLKSFPDASRDVLLGLLALPDEPLRAAQIAVALERRIRSDFEQQRTL